MPLPFLKFFVSVDEKNGCRTSNNQIALNSRHPISAQRGLLGVARSTYRSMRSRADRPAAPDPAAPAVVAAHAASKGRYGSRKIKASPGRSGVTVSRRRVCRIMGENGPVGAYGGKRSRVHPGAADEADAPNAVARGFGGRASHTHKCSDLTYVSVGTSWDYVRLLVHRETFGTTRELRAKLSDYVCRYDNFKIHTTLGYMSPVEFRKAGLSFPESSK